MTSADIPHPPQSPQSPHFSTTEVPPVAPKRPVERVHHGDVVVDDYEWMRDSSDPETLAYLEAENAYTEATTAHLAPLREAIFTEIKTRTQETDLSVPSRTGNHWYYRRTVEGQQYPLLCRVKTAGDDWTPPVLEPGVDVPGEQLLIDCNVLGADTSFLALGATDVSVDEQRFAYAIDLTGSERYTIRVLDLRTGDHLPDVVENTLGNIVWSTDGSYLFYSTVDDAWRADRIWRHRLGTDASDDVVVHREADERFGTGISRTTSNRYLVIESASKITSEARLLDGADPTGDFQVVATRRTGVEYSIDHAVIDGEDRLLVLHNNKDAHNFALGIGPVTLASLDELEPVVEPSDTERLTDLAVSATTLALNLRAGGLPQVRVFRLDSRDDAGAGAAGRLGTGETLQFDEPLFDAAAHAFSDWRQPFVRVSYSSWLTPPTVLEHDPVTGERHVRKQQAILGGYMSADYVQSREWVTARDGTSIPLSLVHSRSVDPRSNSPLLLYGYGSYEIPIDPYPSVSRLSLLDRGVVFAVAHVRGGGEMGRGWYDDGKLLRKKNTFTDFIDCAEHLVDTGWTSPEKLVAQGGSAGGLLMGAVVNAAPDLFSGVVAQVPFVDALTTILNPALPLSVIEWDEWGDPLHDPEVYAYMKSYTPYENVAARDYPAIYSITSLQDTRVLFVEPAKWTAKLRDTVTGSRQILLKCQMAAGHGGVSGRYDAWRETADYLAWVIDIAGAPYEPVTGT